MSTPTVYLVGAGPGDPGLLTLRGAACLAMAEVVVYDRLINERLLDLAPPDAERIFVGKSASHHALEQDEINGLLVEKARGGKTVVRLKGGDPFVFGRGGEEALALVEAGLAFEVVPGVTAGIAAAAYAGIPVTHRGLSSAIVLVTGHEDPTKDESDLDWSKLAAIASIAVYMGVSNLPVIAEALIGAGRSPQTPCVVIASGTTAAQRTVEGTLATIAEKVTAAEVQPPAILLVGEVARLRAKLAWFERRPLFGRRIVVTRTREQASRLSALLEANGAEVAEFPLIEIHEMSDNAELDSAIGRLDEFDWVIFTSANGVDAVIRRLHAAERDARAFGAARVCAIGPATAERLAECGLRADLVPQQYLGTRIAEELIAKGLARDSRILLPRAEVAGEQLPRLLREAGAQVTEVAAYRTLPAKGGREQLRQLLKSGKADVVTFASSSTVRSFVELLKGDDLATLMKRVAVASIGPVTSETVRELGLAVAIEAQEHTIRGLVQALCEWAHRGVPNSNA